MRFRTREEILKMSSKDMEKYIETANARIEKEGLYDKQKFEQLSEADKKKLQDFWDTCKYIRINFD